MQNSFESNTILVQNNYGREWSYKNKDSDLIYFEKLGEESTSLTLEEAQFIVDSLKEIIEYYNNPPKRDDKVKFITGRMEGLYGAITDVDKCDDERPLAVRIKDKSFEGVYYCSYNEISKVSD